MNLYLMIMSCYVTNLATNGGIERNFMYRQDFVRFDLLINSRISYTLAFALSSEKRLDEYILFCYEMEYEYETKYPQQFPGNYIKHLKQLLQHSKFSHWLYDQHDICNGFRRDKSLLTSSNMEYTFFVIVYGCTMKDNSKYSSCY